jgi:hypothetical protein
MSFDEAEYHRIEALRRDAQAIYDERLRQAREAKRATWSEHRAEIMQKWVQIKRAAEERGEPFMMPPQPPLDCPDYYLANVHVPDVPVRRLPEGSANAARIAAGVDPLGRPTQRLLTPEEQFQAMDRERESLGQKVKRAMGGGS